MARTRTYSWADPDATAATALTMSGLAFLRSVMVGELPPPPIAVTLGFRLAEVEEGRVEFGCVPGEEHYNPIGSVHGGLFATLLDSATGCAVHSTLPIGTAYTSLDLAVRFLRPASADTGPMRCVGTVLNRGRRTALGQAELFDSGDRLLAHATSTCLLMPVSGG